MDKKYLVIYHKEDNDGACSAAIMMYYLINKLNANPHDIETFGANYDILSTIADNDFNFTINGKEYDMLTDFDSIVMTDVSFNKFSIMEILYDTYGDDFIWIDHHAPIINESIRQNKDKSINGLRDTKRSALLNAYRFCYDKDDVGYKSGKAPYVLRILSAWDSFTFEQENIDFEYARRVNIGFTKWFDLNVDIWYDMIENIINNNQNYIDESLKYAYEIGSKETDEYDARNEKLLKDFGMGGFKVNGREAIAVFMSEGTSSLIFKSVKDKYKNGICFKTSPTGNIIVSLYNTDRTDHSFHCGTYLHDKYGGGGHEGAAGATLGIYTFLKIMKEKEL